MDLLATRCKTLCQRHAVDRHSQYTAAEWEAGLFPQRRTKAEREMKNILTLPLLLALSACLSTEPNSEVADAYHDLPNSPQSGYLLRVVEGKAYQMGQPCGYSDQNGEVVIPIGKYHLCWTDTIETFGIVWDKELTNAEFTAIDRQGRKLYEVYTYDNGPDWLSDGLFRIMRNGKIGYADAEGQVRIEPRFACAGQFEGGRAKVAVQCQLVNDGEHTYMQSEAWFYIDRTGEIVDGITAAAHWE